MIDEHLITLRSDFDTEVLTKKAFIEDVNAALDSISVSDEYKIKAFDALRDFVVEMLKLTDVSGDGMQYVDDDQAHYLFDHAVEAVLGPNIWEFYNKTYQS